MMAFLFRVSGVALLGFLFCGACAKKEVQPDYGRTLLPELVEEPGGTAPPLEINEDYVLSIDPERIALTREYLSIHNQTLYRALPDEHTLASISFEPKIIVVHYTVIPTLEKVMTYFQPTRIDAARQVVAQNGALNVGVQFVVDRDGSIYRSYPETVMSRHVIGLNHVAIGIENIGDADLGSSDSENALTEAQLQANTRLIKYLRHQYSELRFLIGHMEYRDLEDPAHPAHLLFQEDKPGYRTEKDDPGPRFMAALRQALADSFDDRDIF